MRKQTQIMLIRHNIIRSRNGLGCKIVTILEKDKSFTYLKLFQIFLMFLVFLFLEGLRCYTCFKADDLDKCRAVTECQRAKVRIIFTILSESVTL